MEGELKKYGQGETTEIIRFITFAIDRLKVVSTQYWKHIIISALSTSSDDVFNALPTSVVIGS